MSDNLQKDYIRKIDNIAINPVQCSNNYLNKDTHKYVPGKRYPLDKYPLKDYLTVASNQIVFELDAKTYSTNFEIAKKIIAILEEREIPYYIFASGGKGIHIEVWFTKPQNESKEYKELFVEALSYNLSFKHIRFWLWNKILDEAHLDERIRGIGEVVDSSCINFDDLNYKTRLLRICGGRKIYMEKISLKEEIYYKTFILPDDFNKLRVKIKNFSRVAYPSSLASYELNASEFSEFLQDFVNKAKENKTYQFKRIDLSKNKGYLGLDSVQRVLEGMPTGKRSGGAQVLSIAMTNDNIPEKEQEGIMQKYVDNCSQIGSTFLLTEAMGWVKWVQVQREIFWNCSLVKDLDIHNVDLCNFCKQIYKEANKLLVQSTLLSQIEELLSIEIKGEAQTKMLMFLLMLSKDFPSRTGSSDWLIQGDPQSQNIILSSDSSSGKTWITKKILEVFGEKNIDYFIVSRYTKNVLNYYTELNMDGKIIFIEELQGLDENTSQLRVWMSEGELNLETVEKMRNEEGVEVNTKRTLTTQGQPVFVTNQAEGVIEDQLNNRSWVLSTDISSAQTKHILDYQDLINKGNIKDVEEKKRQIQDALKQLKPYHFIIPYSDNGLLKIPIHDVRSRRDYNKFMTLIKCSAYLHQKQRLILGKQNKEFIICDLRDYDVAKKYSDTILGATFSGLTIQQIDIITFIRNNSWKSEFEITDLMRNLGKTQPYWYGQLNQLCDLGYIIANKQGMGKSTIYSLNEEKTLNLINLPLSSELQEPFEKELKELKKKDFELIQAIKNENDDSEEEDENLNPKIIAQNTVYSHKDIKQGAINNAPLQRTRISTAPKKNTMLQKGEKFIALNTLKLIKSSKNHLIGIEEIINELGTEYTKAINDEISRLLQMGEIIEPKPGKVMLL